MKCKNEKKCVWEKINHNLKKIQNVIIQRPKITGSSWFKHVVTRSKRTSHTERI